MKLNERELENNYPVFAGYMYVIDDIPIRSDITGDFGDLKNLHKAEVIKNCDLSGRDLLDEMV